MQYTPNYNLNLPEGTDIVNPLVQDNPNYSAIDAALYANKLRVVGTASELTTGTVHAITRDDTDIPVFRFTATSDYNTGDTFTVDGVSVTAVNVDATSLKNKAYRINSDVLAILSGTKLTFIGAGGEDVVTPDYIEVTADGIKTVGDLLNELYPLIDESKVTEKTFLAWNYTNGSPYNSIYRLDNHPAGGYYVFNLTSLSTNSPYLATTTRISLTTNSYMRQNDSNGTVTNKTSEVNAAGFKIRIYY